MIKDKINKPRFSLLPINAIFEVIKVFEFGTIKYKKDSWKRMIIKNENDYFDAALRHIFKDWTNKEIIDKESGCYHLAHAITNLLFILWKRITWNLLTKRSFKKG